MAERTESTSSQVRLLLVASSYEMLDAEETKWSTEIKDDHPLGISRVRVHQLFEKLRDQIAIMLSSGWDPREVHRQIQASMTQLSGVLQQFSDRWVPYQEKKRLVEERGDLFDRDLERASLHFTSFTHDPYMAASWETSMQEDWHGAMITQCVAGDFFAERSLASFVDMKEKKKELAQCIRMNMDPDSPFGAELCVAHHAKGLSKEEERELSREVSSMIAGKALSELAALPTVVNAAIKGVVSGVVKLFVMGALAEGLAQGDPANFHERLEDSWSAFKGENPEFNQAMSEMASETKQAAFHALEKCVKGATIAGLAHENPFYYRNEWEKIAPLFEGDNSLFYQAITEWSAGRGYVGNLLQQGRDYTEQLDIAAQERFYTQPGSIQAGIHATAELGTAALVGWGVKKGVDLVRGAKGVQAVETGAAAGQEEAVVAKALEPQAAGKEIITVKKELGWADYAQEVKATSEQIELAKVLKEIKVKEARPSVKTTKKEPSLAAAPAKKAMTYEEELADRLVRQHSKRIKNDLAWRDYARGLESEKNWLELASAYPASDLPKDFPRHLTQFLNECESYPFRLTKLGESGKGILKGHLLYKKMGGEALFFVQGRMTAHQVYEKIGTWRLVESTHLKWYERLAYEVQVINQAAREMGVTNVHCAWDPSALPLATVITNRLGTVLTPSSQSILSVSSLSRGVTEEALSVIKIAIP